jgi:hypothetical protein
MRMLSTIIVGGGPGGLGPLIASAQQGLLPAWLDQGVAIVERRERLGGSLGRYGINSDSLGGSYLECLEAPALPEPLRCLRGDSVTHEMAEYRHSYPPLELVDRYMSRLGEAIEVILADRPASTIRRRTTAQALRLRSDGAVAVDIQCPDDTCDTLIARSAVFALGGRQFWQTTELLPGLTLAQCHTRRVLPSDRILERTGLAEANDILAGAGARRILVLGGAHSAYAVAWALLHLPAAATLGPGQIVILQRRPPRVFYPDSAAAAADLYPFEPGDICPRTQRVNRMGGLRGHGRDIWREIAGRPGTTTESRVAMLAFLEHSAGSLRAAIEDAALVVPCFGYRSATLPVFDAEGQRLFLNADAFGEAVGDDCRLRLADGGRLDNVFGIGLGTGYRISGSMGGEPNFVGQANSLWLYQNDIGAVIHREIQMLLRAPASAIAAWVPRGHRLITAERAG